MEASYPPDWDRRRKQVYQRDNYTCQVCGIRGGPHGEVELHAHHKTPIGRGGSHEMDNLETLCYVCHSKKHGGRRWRSSKPFIMDRYMGWLSNFGKGTQSRSAKDIRDRTDGSDAPPVAEIMEKGHRRAWAEYRGRGTWGAESVKELWRESVQDLGYVGAVFTVILAAVLTPLAFLPLVLWLGFLAGFILVMAWAPAAAMLPFIPPFDAELAIWISLGLGIISTLAALW